MISAYLVNEYREQKGRRRAEQAEAERFEQAVRSSVAEMVSRHGASHGWEAQLGKGKEFRFEPILTVELERLWLTERPILFVGSVLDIASCSETMYRVALERSLYSVLDHMFDTELQLSLRCPKAMIDDFLTEHAELSSDSGFSYGVAIVAKIHAIHSDQLQDPDGGHQDVRIGEGECVDIVYTGDVGF